MITHTPADSAYYVENANYCKQIIKELDSYNATYSGFCNAYGYTIESSILYKGRRIKFEFSKEQRSIPSDFVPRDAINYHQVKMKAGWLKSKSTFKVGYSKLKRIFLLNKSIHELDHDCYLIYSAQLPENAIKAIEAFVSKNGETEIELGKRNFYLQTKSKSGAKELIDFMMTIDENA